MSQSCQSTQTRVLVPIRSVVDPLANLQTLVLFGPSITDAGPAQFQWGLPSHQSNRKRLETSECFAGGDLWKSISRESF